MLLFMSQDGEIYEGDRDFNNGVYGRGATPADELNDVMIDQPAVLNEQLLAEDRRQADAENAKALAMGAARRTRAKEAKAFHKRRLQIAEENRDMVREGLMGDDPLLEEAVLSSFGSPADFSVTNFDRNGLSPIGEPDWTMQMGFEPPAGSMAGDSGMGDFFSDQRDAILGQGESALLSAGVNAGVQAVTHVLMPAPSIPAAPASTATTVPMPSNAGGSIAAGGVPFMKRKVAGVPMPAVLGISAILGLGLVYGMSHKSKR